MRLDYDDETLHEINANADLIEYVSQTLELEKRGDNYFAHCPKHIDKTPSLCFSKIKNSFYCFSCGRYGGIIGYLIQYMGVSFEDAVEEAARLANIDLSKMCRSQTMTFLKKVKTVIQESPHEKYEHRILDKSDYLKYKREPVQEWLDEGIKQEVMDLFGVRIDTYQNRIIYPVYDTEGNLINIKGRTRYPNFKKLKIPKYINYFPVGVMDYFQGLNLTLPYIKDSNEIIIFESIKSVMLAYGWGYRNCASAETHGLTNEQIDLLVRLKVNITFAYDTDVNCRKDKIWSDIKKLKRLTNVYLVEDKHSLLGGKETKNAPVDLGKEIWDELYEERKKVV